MHGYDKELSMKCGRPLLGLLGLVSTLFVLTGCAYQAALQHLAPAEQRAFRAYSKVMTPAQARAYLTKPTAAERTAYLAEIGIVQRFQALEPQDREAVLAGYPRKEMSVDALRFLWGEPYHTKGWTGHYEHWYYMGSSLALADRGNQYDSPGTMVEVYLVDGRVEWWRDFVPTRGDEGGDDGGRR